ncbi:hypothetical protein KFL_000470040 [Klebsormidium nitens]|uniref:Uncharacterized protein n=1 Tax=Klebsormidium nitens TaxID=105231 RepID=A0A1Y1HNB5_KLENI|nr:hypothetical protein KFL_000470040 [Klebsormidium nitens]|eukprot:GAQ80130.1 hypothetical protein KFL_000470040 [Klebsormidium nitens]
MLAARRSLLAAASARRCAPRAPSAPRALFATGDQGVATARGAARASAAGRALSARGMATGNPGVAVPPGQPRKTPPMLRHWSPEAYQAQTDIKYEYVGRWGPGAPGRGVVIIRAGIEHDVDPIGTKAPREPGVVYYREKMGDIVPGNLGQEFAVEAVEDADVSLADYGERQRAIAAAMDREQPSGATGPVPVPLPVTEPGGDVRGEEATRVTVEISRSVTVEEDPPLKSRLYRLLRNFTLMAGHP